MAQQPRIVAHRGVARHYPENTLPALEAAPGAGADAVELDVQMSADGVPMVIHDALLDRTTDASGPVAALTAAELARISAHEPDRLGERYLGACIPRLDDAARRLARHPDLTVFVELKPDALTHCPAHRAVPRVLEATRALGARRVLISFSDAALQTARSLETIAIGWVLPAWDRATLERAGVLAPEFIFCDHRRLPPEPAALPAGAWQWVVYEVAGAELACALVRRGVTWLEGMDPAALRGALSRCSPSRSAP